MIGMIALFHSTTALFFSPFLFFWVQPLFALKVLSIAAPAGVVPPVKGVPIPWLVGVLALGVGAPFCARRGRVIPLGGSRRYALQRDGLPGRITFPIYSGR